MTPSEKFIEFGDDFTLIKWTIQVFALSRFRNKVLLSRFEKSLLQTIEPAYIPMLVLEGNFGDRNGYFLELYKKEIVACCKHRDMIRLKRSPGPQADEAKPANMM